MKQTIKIFSILILFAVKLYSQQFQWISQINGGNNQLPTGNRIVTNPNGQSHVVGTYYNQTVIGTVTLSGNATQYIRQCTLGKKNSEHGNGLG